MQLKFSGIAIDTPCGRRILTIDEATLNCGITALIGQNGVGKSTLLRTIFGLHPLTEGTITLDNIDSRMHRQRFLVNAVFQPQNFTAYPDLTGLEFLKYFLRLRGFSSKEALIRASQWIARVDLSDAANHLTSEYSQGMLQRLGLAYALQSGAQLCVLDEPFAGVDPLARSQLSDLLADMAVERTILICTHHVEEMAERGAEIVSIDNNLWVSGVAA
jgi:ABC-2 type transport system ATP-binding protein